MLVIDKAAKVFDVDMIKKGDCIRVKYSNDPYYKNGFVTLASEEKIQLLYSNNQGNAASYLQIPAKEVSAGLWEIYWTSDFITINHESGDTDA